MHYALKAWGETTKKLYILRTNHKRTFPKMHSIPELTCIMRSFFFLCKPCFLNSGHRMYLIKGQRIWACKNTHTHIYPFLQESICFESKLVVLMSRKKTVKILSILKKQLKKHRIILFVQGTWVNVSIKYHTTYS